MDQIKSLVKFHDKVTKKMVSRYKSLGFKEDGSLWNPIRMHKESLNNQMYRQIKGILKI